MGKDVGADGFDIDPGHPGADRDCRRDHEEGDCGRKKGTEEAGNQIVELGDPGGLYHRTEAGFIVAHDHVGDEGGRHEHEEDGKDEVDLGDCSRAVHLDVAARADRDLLDRGGTEGEEEEQDCDNPEDGVSELVAQFEGCNLCEHCAPQAARAAGARRVRASVAK